MSHDKSSIFSKYQDHPEFIGIDIVGPNTKGALDDTLMHLVSRSGKIDEMECLISLGGNINDKGDLGYTPLHYAAMTGQEEMIKYLLRNGADLTARNEFGETPKDCAVNGNHTELEKLL